MVSSKKFSLIFLTILFIALFVAAGCGSGKKEAPASGENKEVPISQYILVERATTQVKEQGADVVAKLAGDIDLEETAGDVTGEGRSILKVEGVVPAGTELTGSGVNSFKKVKGTFKDGKLHLKVESSAFWGGVGFLKNGQEHLLSGFDQFPEFEINLPFKEEATTSVKFKNWEISYTLRREK